MQSSYSVSWFHFVPVSTTAHLFDFKDFAAALTLLVIIYTISDVRYRFRVAVAPAPLLKLSFTLVGLVGLGTLATDVWMAEHWLVPDSLLTTPVWQGILATLFLGLVITWMWYAFIKPPRFGRGNYYKYAQALYKTLLKGSETELPIIADELGASAKSLVTFAAALRKTKSRQTDSPKPCPEGYANDMLLLIANRKFCRHVVASAPATAIRFLDEVARCKAYDVPIGLFVQNIATEAIQNKDSNLYHEDEGYYSGLFGYIKPLSYALYGSYELVSALHHSSPLDVHYRLVWSFDADQFETYCRVVHITLKDYLTGGFWGRDHAVLVRALGNIQTVSAHAIRELENRSDDYTGDAWYRLNAGTDFIRSSIESISKLEPVPAPRQLRIHDRRRVWDHDLYDHLADAMFEIIHSAASVRGSADAIWGIQYNCVWSKFFSLAYTDQAWENVRFKLRRRLYDEIRRLESFPNFKGARVLGICLNAMGLKAGRRTGYGREDAALRWAVVKWTQRNYLELREANPAVADACLVGSITFDQEHSRLVKTFARGLEMEPPREYLELQ